MSDEFDEIDEGRGGSSVNPLFVIAILFFPGLIVGYIFYSLLRFAKFKLSFISLIAGITTIITAIFGKIVLDRFDSITEIPALITLYLIVCIIFGAWIGVFYARKELLEIRDNPHLLEMPGTWTYKLKLKKTPWEKRKIKKSIQQLKNGELVDKDRAPLGIEIELGENNENKGSLNKNKKSKTEDFLYETDNVVYRYDNEAVKHTLAVGASGSGKTITMLSLIRKNILMNEPVIIIDMKRSAELASKVAKWTKEAGGNFYHFVNGEPENYDVKDSPGQAFYDPLSGGTPTSNADMILGMRAYDDASAHYKTNMQQVLQILFKMIFFGQKEIAKDLKRQKKAKEILLTNPPNNPKQVQQLKNYAEGSITVKNALTNIDWNSGGIYLLASALKNLDTLEKLVKDTEVGIDASEMMAMVRERQTNPIKHSIQELQGQLRTITSSEYGKWLKTEKGKESLNLFELTQKPGSVILFSLNSDSEPEFAKFVGSIILSDITNVAAKRRNKGLKNMVNVYVDEFQAVPPSSVTSLLEKSRESRIAMTLAQQSFDQIISSAPSNGQAYLGSILDTCSNFIIHAGSTEPSAQILAGIIGKAPKTKYIFSFNKSGKKNKKKNKNQQFQQKQEMDWIFDPSEFMNLMMPDPTNNFKSTAVIINKTSSDEKFLDRSGALARKVWMIPDSKVLDDYYIPTFQDDVSNKLDESINEQFKFLSNNEITEDEDGQMIIADTTSIIDDIEDNDGGFAYETIETEDNDSDYMDEIIYSNEEPIQESTTAASMFRNGFKPQTRKEYAIQEKSNQGLTQSVEVNNNDNRPRPTKLSNPLSNPSAFVLPDLDE